MNKPRIALSNRPERHRYKILCNPFMGNVSMVSDIKQDKSKIDLGPVINDGQYLTMRFNHHLLEPVLRFDLLDINFLGQYELVVEIARMIPIKMFNNGNLEVYLHDDFNLLHR